MSVVYETRGYAFVLKYNEMYAQKLSKVIQQIPKKVLGVFAATALDQAISLTFTKEDSGRAAANWNLNFGNEMPSAEWTPYKEHGSVNGVGNIGQKGDKGEDPGERAIREYKALYYQYETVGNFQVPIVNGSMHRRIGVGVKGTAPVIKLYNPIFRELPEGSPAVAYAYNAFGRETMDAILYSPLMGSVSTSFFPKYLQELAQTVRWAHANKTI